jgi:hypothetical protein
LSMFNINHFNFHFREFNGQPTHNLSFYARSLRLGSQNEIEKNKKKGV